MIKKIVIFLFIVCLPFFYKPIFVFADDQPACTDSEDCQKKIANCQKYKIADYCVAKDLENIKQ